MRDSEPRKVWESMSYAGMYRLEYLDNGWCRFFCKGKEIGAIRRNECRGVYQTAVFFGM